MNLINSIKKITLICFTMLGFFSCKNKVNVNVYCPTPELGKDVVLSQGYPNKNYSKLDALNLLALTRDDTIENDSRFLLKFNFNSVPLKSKVDSAYIYLKAKSPGHFGSENSFKAEIIIENWNDKQVNWLNQPKTDSSYPITIKAPNDKLQDYKIDVTNYVSDIVKQKHQNFGLLFRLESENPPFKGIRFYSSNAKEELRRPKLVVYFR